MIVEGKKYLDCPSWEAYEEALKNCNWDWHLIEDEVEREKASETWVEMEERRISLVANYVTSDLSSPNMIEARKIQNLYNKYAPQKYHREVN